MILGFTGTRNGMTEAQKRKFAALLRERGVTELHHGDCVGADEDAHNIARQHGINIVIHPPVDSADRAFCMGAYYTHQPRTHFQRNRDIVADTDALAATPLLEVETPTGGTWYTIRAGRKRHVAGGVYQVFVIWPSGKLEIE